MRSATPWICVVLALAIAVALSSWIAYERGFRRGHEATSIIMQSDQYDKYRALKLMLDGKDYGHMTKFIDDQVKHYQMRGPQMEAR